MSWALVKRGLDLFDEDELRDSHGTLKKVRDGNKGKVKEVGTHRQGIKKASRQKKRAKQLERETHNQLIQKQVANALKEYQKKAPGDRTEENLKLLKKFDGKLKQSYVKKITEQHSKTLEERITKSEWQERLKRKPAEGSTSVFSEEDFEKMNEIWLRLNT
ncbi:hypothetical protein SK128_012021 [Halocaridina rubra]|uniref:Active regulator of SIRT1 n=1 Tax=Halocaridina rubra TaxID=373956 RepID=A0AAN8X2P4_HALRR